MDLGYLTNLKISKSFKTDDILLDWRWLPIDIMRYKDTHIYEECFSIIKQIANTNIFTWNEILQWSMYAERVVFNSYSYDYIQCNTIKNMKILIVYLINNRYVNKEQIVDNLFFDLNEKSIVDSLFNKRIVMRTPLSRLSRICSRTPHPPTTPHPSSSSSSSSLSTSHPRPPNITIPAPRLGNRSVNVNNNSHNNSHNSHNNSHDNNNNDMDMDEFDSDDDIPPLID